MPKLLQPLKVEILSMATAQTMESDANYDGEKLEKLPHIKSSSSNIREGEARKILYDSTSI